MVFSEKPSLFIKTIVFLKPKLLDYQKKTINKPSIKHHMVLIDVFQWEIVWRQYGD